MYTLSPEGATVGAISGDLPFAPAGGGILLPLGSSQHRGRLVAARRKTGQKPGPTSHFITIGGMQ